MAYTRLVRNLFVLLHRLSGTVSCKVNHQTHLPNNPWKEMPLLVFVREVLRNWSFVSVGVSADPSVSPWRLSCKNGLHSTAPCCQRDTTPWRKTREMYVLGCSLLSKWADCLVQERLAVPCLHTVPHTGRDCGAFILMGHYQAHLCSLMSSPGDGSRPLGWGLSTRFCSTSCRYFAQHPVGTLLKMAKSRLSVIS